MSILLSLLRRSTSREYKLRSTRSKPSSFRSNPICKNTSKSLALMPSGMTKSKKIDNDSGELLRSLGSMGKFLKGRGISKADLVAVGVPCLRYVDIYTKYGDVGCDLK